MRKIYFITADKWDWTVKDTDATEFYMLEYMLEDLEEKIKQENKEYNKQEQENKKQMATSKPSKSNFGKPDFGGFKIPKMPTPKF